MSQANLVLTDKITRHRTHVERLISRIKDFKVLSHRIAAHLFPRAEPGLVSLLLFDVISGLCSEENMMRACVRSSCCCTTTRTSLPCSFYQDFSKEDKERIT